MWVLTENKELVNLDHASVIRISEGGEHVYASTPGLGAYEGHKYHLCYAWDSETARMVIRRIGDAIARGDTFLDIMDALEPLEEDAR